MNLSLLVGFILPPFIDLINLKITNNLVKFWVAMGVCFLIGLVTNLDKLKDLESLLGNLGIIFAESQVVYRTYWEKSSARQALEKRI